VLGGAIMFVYTCLLLVTNRRYLPAAVQLRGYRVVILGFAVAMLGVTTAIVAVDQIKTLF
jgi:heme A synthase